MKYKEIKIFTNTKELDNLVELLASNDITDVVISYINNYINNGIIMRLLIKTNV